MEPWYLIEARAALLACRSPAAPWRFAVALHRSSRIGSEYSRLNFRAGALLLGRGRLVAKDAGGKARHRVLVGADDEWVVLHKLVKQRNGDLRLVLEPDTRAHWRHSQGRHECSIRASVPADQNIIAFVPPKIASHAMFSACENVGHLASVTPPQSCSTKAIGRVPGVIGNVVGSPLTESSTFQTDCCTPSVVGIWPGPGVSVG